MNPPQPHDRRSRLLPHYLILGMVLIVCIACAGQPVVTLLPATSTTVTAVPLSSTSPVSSQGFHGTVDVGGYRLFLNCAGTGNPTVVMDAGVNDTSTTWALVWPVVAKVTRVCVYDRAGLGASDHSPAPRITSEMVMELRTLLRNAGTLPPYVLVGHSFGGLNMQYYAHQYRDEVAGRVLVDSSHPAQFARYRAALPFSLPHPCPDLELLRATPGGPEHVDWDTSVTQVPVQAGSLGMLPLVVLTHGHFAWTCLPDPLITKVEQVWQELQQELVHLSSEGHQVIATKSGHFIQLDQPDLVITAIQGVVNAAHSFRRSIKLVHAGCSIVHRSIVISMAQGSVYL